MKSQNLNGKAMFTDPKEIDTLIMQLEYPENMLKIHFDPSSTTAFKTTNKIDGS